MAVLTARLLILHSLLVLLPLAAWAQNCENIGALQQCSYNWTGYNETHYPNPVVNNVEDAISMLPTLRMLEGCSPNLQRFVCSALLPRCGHWLGPCRNLCEVVRSDCSRQLVSNNAAFLQLADNLLLCTRYPNVSCVAALVTVTPSQTTTAAPSPTVTPPAPSSTPGAVLSNETGCPPPSITYYTDSAKGFTMGWIATWSTFCFLSTSLTLLTFIIKPSRFEYPWRPIVYLALCFNIHSLGYFFALLLGRKIITCPGDEYFTSATTWGWQHVPCLLNFGLLYYSMVATFLWWLTLTLSWFLSSVFKWSNEAVGRLAPFFHVTAWVLPLLMMISLIAGQIISADELTGTCFIVRDNTTPTLYALLIGVIIPLMAFLLIGLFFLLVGLISVLRIRSFLHRKGRQKESMVLEKLLFRIVIFVAVYVLPAGVVIGCFFYELIVTPKWSTVNESCSDCTAADPVVVMVRIFMFLLIGSLTGVWIWSKKTLESWRGLGSKCYNCCLSLRQSYHDKPPHSSSSIVKS